MRRFLPNTSRTQLISYILFFLSACILGFTIYMNVKTDVLKDWRLVLPQQDIRIGDSIVLQSLYTKVMDVSGKSTRYIECKTSNGVFVRYPISEAVANRAAGQSGTGIPVVIPSTIPNVPTTCRFNITIEYEVFIWRKHIESVNSEIFTLNPAKESLEVSVQENEPPQTNQNLATSQRPAESLNNPSSTNTTQSDAAAQRDISQGSDIVVQSERQLDGKPEQPQPSLLQTILNPVTNLIGGK